MTNFFLFTAQRDFSVPTSVATTCDTDGSSSVNMKLPTAQPSSIEGDYQPGIWQEKPSEDYLASLLDFPPNRFRTYRDEEMKEFNTTHSN